MTSSGVVVAVEAVIENKIQEVRLNGQEFYETPLSMSENLTKNALKIDFGKDEQAETGKKTSEGEKEAEEEKVLTPFQPSLWPWDSVRNKLKASLIEMSVLLDVLNVSKEKRYLVLDPISSDMSDSKSSDSKQSIQILAKKRSLMAAATLLITGSERLKVMQVEQGSRAQNDFHTELSKLRQNWRLKKVGESILGDLSYKSVGSRFYQGGTFEVSKTTLDSGDRGDTISPRYALEVKIPSELEGVAYIQVEVKTVPDSIDLTSATLKMPHGFGGLSSDAYWQRKLEVAQNVLFCKELFAQVTLEIKNGYHEDNLVFSGISKELYLQLVNNEEEIDYWCDRCGVPNDQSSTPGTPNAESSRVSLLNNSSSEANGYIDGTFKVVTAPFHQLLSIHAFIRSGEDCKMVPMAFGIMSRRKAKDYIKVLGVLKNATGSDLSVKVVVGDFEKAVWKACHKMLDGVRMRGCVFHWTQCIWRKCAGLGLQLARESVQVKLDTPHLVVGNQIITNVFPGVQLSIILCHYTGKEKRVPVKLEHNHVLEHSLHQLLREYHYKTLNYPAPHPVTATFGMSKRRRLAGPEGLDKRDLLELTESETLLEQITKQTKHTILRLRVMQCIDKLASEIQDPQITAHWSCLNSATESSVKIYITTSGYESVRTFTVLQIGIDTIKAILKDGRTCNMSFEVKEVEDFILWLISQHQISATQILTKILGWVQLSCSGSVGVGEREDLSTASSIMIASPNHDKILSIRSGPTSGIHIFLKDITEYRDPGSPLSAVTDSKWLNLGGKFEEIDVTKLEGKHLTNKLEGLMATLMCSQTT